MNQNVVVLTRGHSLITSGNRGGYVVRPCVVKSYFLLLRGWGEVPGPKEAKIALT